MHFVGSNKSYQSKRAKGNVASEVLALASTSFPTFSSPTTMLPNEYQLEAGIKRALPRARGILRGPQSHRGRKPTTVVTIPVAS